MVGVLRLLLPSLTVPYRPLPSYFVAANIPIANLNRPHPASSRGTPVARSTRANQYTTEQMPDVVSAQSASRATAGTGRDSAMRDRAASSPWPYCTPDG